MTPDDDPPPEVTELRDWLRQEIAAGDRARARAQFEDMGYEDCPTCRRARLRSEFAAIPTAIRRACPRTNHADPRTD